jgi:transcriptional regulator with XRE-family HTH domain
MYLNSDIMSGFGSRLRAERLAKSLSQKDFAAIGGIQRNAQIAYEGGKKLPSVEYLYLLVGHGVDIGYIITGQHHDRSIGLDEQAFLRHFTILSDDQKTAVLALLEAMPRGTALSAEAPPIGYQQTLHSPASDYRPRPKD